MRLIRIILPLVLIYGMIHLWAEDSESQKNNCKNSDCLALSRHGEPLSHIHREALIVPEEQSEDDEKQEKNNLVDSKKTTLTDEDEQVMKDEVKEKKSSVMEKYWWHSKER